MIAYNCMIARGLDMRHWVHSDCINGTNPEDAAERYLRAVWADYPSEIEHEVPMLVRVVDDEDRPHDFHITPRFTVKFDVEEWSEGA